MILGASMMGAYKTYVVRRKDTGELVIEGGAYTCARRLGINPSRLYKLNETQKSPYTVTVKTATDQPDTTKCQTCVCFERLGDNMGKACHHLYYLRTRRQIGPDDECLSYIDKRKGSDARSRYERAKRNSFNQSLRGPAFWKYEQKDRDLLRRITANANL